MGVYDCSRVDSTVLLVPVSYIPLQETMKILDLMQDRKEVETSLFLKPHFKLFLPSSADCKNAAGVDFSEVNLHFLFFVVFKNTLSLHMITLQM